MSDTATMTRRRTDADLLVDGSSALVREWTPSAPPVQLVADVHVPPVVEPVVARRAGGVALAVGAAVAVVSFLSGLVWAPPTEAPDDAVVVVVEAGDTLWSVARDAVPVGDIAPIVAALDAERGGAPLQVGEAIVVDLG